MKVSRVTLAGAEQAVTFANSTCAKWLVKNFSDGDVFCSFEQGQSANGVKIASGCAQVVVDNENNGGHISLYRHDTIYVNGTGEVEVQQLCWKETNTIQ